MTLRPFPLLLSVCLALTGCKLIDQKTFAPSPEAAPPPVAAVAPPKAASVESRPPLVVIAYTTANPDYRGLLNSAVQAAESRIPGVQYDVIGVARSDADTALSQERAAGVMRAIMQQRVPASRIHLGVRTDAALTSDQVRVYVH